MKLPRTFLARLFSFLIFTNLITSTEPAWAADRSFILPAQCQDTRKTTISFIVRESWSRKEHLILGLSRAERAEACVINDDVKDSFIKIFDIAKRGRASYPDLLYKVFVEKPENDGIKKSASPKKMEATAAATKPPEKPKFLGDPISLLSLKDDAVAYPFKYDHITELWNSSITGQLERLRDKLGTSALSDLCTVSFARTRATAQEAGFYDPDLPSIFELSNKKEFRDTILSGVSKLFGSRGNSALLCTALSYWAGDWVSYGSWAYLADQEGIISTFLAHAYLYGIGMPRDFEAAAQALQREYDRTKNSKQKTVIGMVIGQLGLLEPAVQRKRTAMLERSERIAPEWHDVLLHDYNHCRAQKRPNCDLSLISFSGVASSAVYARHTANLDGVLLKSGDWVVRKMKNGFFVAETFAADKSALSSSVQQTLSFSCRKGSNSIDLLLTVSTSDVLGVNGQTAMTLAAGPSLFVKGDGGHRSGYILDDPVTEVAYARIFMRSMVGAGVLKSFMTSQNAAQVDVIAEGALRDRILSDVYGGQAYTNVGIPLAKFSTKGSSRAIRTALQECRLRLP